VCEVLLATPAVRDAVRAGRTADLDAVLVAGAGTGMQPFDRALAAAVVAGRVAPEVAASSCRDRAALAGHVTELQRTAAQTAPPAAPSAAPAGPPTAPAGPPAAGPPAAPAGPPAAAHPAPPAAPPVPPAAP
jgi:hypothetical protein